MFLKNAPHGTICLINLNKMTITFIKAKPLNGERMTKSGFLLGFIAWIFTLLSGDGRSICL